MIVKATTRVVGTQLLKRRYASTRAKRLAYRAATRLQANWLIFVLMQQMQAAANQRGRWLARRLKSTRCRGIVKRWPDLRYGL